MQYNCIYIMSYKFYINIYRKCIDTCYISCYSYLNK
nr:MAG TPA: hypothetical protein [Bacteriophage sp.]